jgi:PAS domain S-box-containing protein
MSFSLRGVAWTAFAVAVALLLGCSIYLVRATTKFSSGEALVGHTREVRVSIENLSAEVFEASNSAQGYVLTGDNDLLSGYRSAVAAIPGDLDHLRNLTADNPQRKPQLEAVSDDIESELALLSGFIDKHRKGIASLDSDARMARETAELQLRVQTRLQQIRDEEDRLLSSRQALSRANYRHTLNMIAISFAVALLLLVAQMFLLNYSYNQYRRTESAAKESREIVNAFFSSSTVGFGILDSNLRYTRVNDVLPRMVALNPEDLLGKSVTEIFGPRGTRTEAVLRNVLMTGTPLLDREISAELPSTPGDIRHWLLNYFPIPGQSGKFTQLGIIAVDVTARRNAEAALRKLSGRLLGIQDQERRRIARELHDSLGQYLAGLKIAVEMLLASPSPEKQKVLLAECSDILEKSISETRTLSHLLHPPLLDEAGFASAARWFATGFSQRSGISVHLEIPEDLPRLSEAVEIALFRVLQEALTNVHRHSRAGSAEIKLELDAEQVTLEITDHGRGMPSQVLQQLQDDGGKLGVGLAGMRERIHELSGKFDVASNENGTCIRATIPFTVGEEFRQTGSDAIMAREKANLA